MVHENTINSRKCRAHFSSSAVFFKSLTEFPEETSENTIRQVQSHAHSTRCRKTKTYSSAEKLTKSYKRNSQQNTIDTIEKQADRWIYFQNTQRENLIFHSHTSTRRHRFPHDIFVSTDNWRSFLIETRTISRNGKILMVYIRCGRDERTKRERALQ